MLEGKAVLVVDDEAGIRFVATAAVAAAGGEAFEAANGREAIRTLERIGIDLAVIDIFMPEREGLETISEAKRRWPGLKVIAISGGGQIGSYEVLSVARAMGADLALPKPLDIKALVGQIARLLGLMPT